MIKAGVYKTSTYVDKETKEHIQELSRRNGTSEAETLRILIDLALEVSGMSVSVH